MRNADSAAEDKMVFEFLLLAFVYDEAPLVINKYETFAQCESAANTTRSLVKNDYRAPYTTDFSDLEKLVEDFNATFFSYRFLYEKNIHNAFELLERLRKDTAFFFRVIDAGLKLDPKDNRVKIYNGVLAIDVEVQRLMDQIKRNSLNHSTENFQVVETSNIHVLPLQNDIKASALAP
jgi:hypothetical protein